MDVLPLALTCRELGPSGKSQTCVIHQALLWQRAGKGEGVSKAHRQRASLEDYEVPANGGAV